MYLKIISCITFICLVHFLAIAQSTWTGGGDGIDYNDPLNWNNNMVPQLGQAIIPKGDTATIVVGDTIQFSSASLTGGGVIRNLGAIRITSVFTKQIFDSTTIISNGTIRHEEGLLRIGSGVIINYGLHDILGDLSLDFSSGQYQIFRNEGTIRKSEGAGIAKIQLTLVNSGVVQTKQGTLEIIRDGSFSSGTNLLVDAGAEMKFINATHTYGGTILGNAVGQLNIGSSINVAMGDTATLDISGDEVHCTACLFQGGGKIIINQKLNMSSSSVKKIDGNTAVCILDSMVIADGSLQVDDGSLVNKGVIDFINDLGNISFNFAGQHELVNEGLLTKSGGTGTSFTQVNITNYGSIVARAGTLEILGDGKFKDQSILQADLGAQLTLMADQIVEGEVFGMAEGSLALNATLITLDTAVFNFSGDGANCGSCVFSGGGKLIIENKLNLNSSSVKRIIDSTLVCLVDTLIVEDGTLLIDDGQLVNKGVVNFINDQGNFSFNGGDQHDFINTPGSVLIKSGGSGANELLTNTEIAGTAIVHSGTLRFTLGLSSPDSAIYKGNGTFDVFEVTDDVEALINGTLMPGIHINDIGKLTWRGHFAGHLITDIASDTSDQYFFMDNTATTHIKILSNQLNLLEAPNRTSYQIAVGTFLTDDPDGCNESCSYDNTVGFGNLVPHLPPQAHHVNDMTYALEHQPVGDATCFAQTLGILVTDSFADGLKIYDLGIVGDPGEYGTVSELASPGDTIRIDASLNGSILKPGFFVPETGFGTPKMGCGDPCVCDSELGQIPIVTLPLYYFADPSQNITIKDSINRDPNSVFANPTTIGIHTNGTLTYDGFDFNIFGSLYGTISGILEINNYDLVIKNADISLDNVSLDGISIGEKSFPEASGSVTLGPGTTIWP